MELDYEDFDIMPRDKKTKYPQDDQNPYNEDGEDYDPEDEYSCYR